MAEVILYDFLKEKFPILIVLGLFSILMFVLGMFIPESVSCCGDGCPLVSRENYVMGMNERFDIIDNVLHSFPFALALILSFATLCYTTTHPEKSLKRFLKLTLFDWNVLIITVLLFARCIFYVNTISGFHFGGCV